MGPDGKARCTPVGRGDAHEEEILVEQVRHLYALAPIGMVATLINALIVFFILREVLPGRLLIPWLVAIIAVTLFRLGCILRFRHLEFSSATPRTWGRRFIAGLVLAGTAWGLIGLFPFVRMTNAHEVFIAFVLGGMAAGAAATFSALKGCYPAFALPALMPLAIHFFLQQTVLHFAMGGMLSFYGLLLWRVSGHNYRVNRDSLLLRSENREIIDCLKQAKEQAEELNSQLITEIDAKLRAETEIRAYHEHLEGIVKERTAELLRTNAQLKSEIEDRKLAEAALKEAQEKLTAAKEAAESANWAKSEFLTNMSHEMRTPLAGAKGMIDLVLEMEIGDRPRQLLEMAKRSTDSLLRLISDLLDFSCLEAGTMSFERKPFSLADVIKTAVEVVSIHAVEKGLDLSWEIDEAAPGQMDGDEGRLRQVLVNLLGNSVKFTRSGEILVTVHPVENPAGREGRFLLFSVRDTGPGIAPDQLERIFGKFIQVDSSWTRKHGGAGLGLALAKQIVEKSGGDIWAESRVGEGSVFHFTYPLAPPRLPQ